MLGAAGCLLRVVRLRLADRFVERRREAASHELRHQQAGSAALFYTQPHDFEAKREVERSE
jgi:ribosomal protein L10